MSFQTTLQTPLWPIAPHSTQITNTAHTGFCDGMTAAFDTVNHQILLSTIKMKGILGSTLQWFKSYLSDRSFRVSWMGGCLRPNI